ncbi:hypothetical protein FNU79_02795 [Deinococcus detaillensis]|uniref:Uncharacterized protein n=1 Tax=Deinococcus detaillensis TaxID=2592048 RepID=A0A553V4P3_9DEIO|nr:hypothetical protein [Deinococcus detaillensis]TSA87429.1 hypothetical protein FNU79_02795 [Deinococcus detaillensis]
MTNEMNGVTLNHPEALALLTWLDELHLQVPAAADPALHAAMAKLRSAKGQEAELVEGSGRVYDLSPKSK